MQVAISLLFNALLISALLSSWRILFLKMHNSFSPDSYCPLNLKEYLYGSFPACLPPRSDHRAPDLKSKQAPQALCLLWEQAGLPPEAQFFPYKMNEESDFTCGYQ